MVSMVFCKFYKPAEGLWQTIYLGVANGGQGVQTASLDSEKKCQKSGKRGRKSGKSGKKRE